MKQLIYAVFGIAVIATGIWLVQWRAAESHSIDATTLLVGTELSYSPFSYMQDGQAVGFDIDVVREVGRRLHKEIVFTAISFDALLPQIQTGLIHIIAAGISATKEREKKVYFTKPYFTSDSLIIITLANSAPIESVNDLQGKVVVVNEGYTADTYMSTFAGIELLRLETVAEAFLVLHNKRADAFVTARSSVRDYFAKHSHDNMVITPIDGVADSVSLAVSKKYPELYESVNAALAEMEQDGTLTMLRRKWGLNND